MLMTIYVDSYSVKNKLFFEFTGSSLF